MTNSSLQNLKDNGQLFHMIESTQKTVDLNLRKVKVTIYVVHSYAAALLAIQHSEWQKFPEMKGEFGWLSTKQCAEA